MGINIKVNEIHSLVVGYISTMALRHRWIPLETYQQFSQAWVSVSIFTGNLLSPPRAVRIR